MSETPLQRRIAELEAEQEAFSRIVKTVDGRPVESSTISTVDADTLRVGNRSHRLTGFNAPEVAKIRRGVFTPNDLLDDPSIRDATAIANMGEYNNLVPTGKIDKYKRSVSDLQNPSKENLGDKLVTLGLQRIGHNTDLGVIREQILTEASASLMPSMAAVDPMLSYARQAKEQEIRKAGSAGVPLYSPTRLALDEQQFAAIKGMTGIPAISEISEEIARLEGILKKDNLSPQTRANLTKKLDQERESLWFANEYDGVYSGSVIRRNDRDRLNRAYSQVATSIDSAYTDTLKSVTGNLEMLGEGMEWEGLRDWARAHNRGFNAYQGDLPLTINSYTDIRTDDGWSAIKDTAMYATNLLIGSMPHLMVMAAATIATAPIGGIGGFAASTLPGSLLYSGQFYADQPEDAKNPQLALTLALTAGTLDRVGLAGLLFKGNILTKEGRKEAIAALTAKGMTQDQAKTKLQEATKAEIVDMLKAGNGLAQKQVYSIEAASKAMALASFKSVQEGTLEMGQGYLEMMAKTGAWNTDIQYEKEFWETMINSAVGGVTLGTIFAGYDSVKTTADWQIAMNNQAEFQGAFSEAQAYQNDVREKALAAGVDMPTIESMVDREGTIPLNQPLAWGSKELPIDEGAKMSMASVFRRPGQLLFQLAHAAFPTLRKKDGTFKNSVAKLKAMVGGYGILPGMHAAKYKQNKMGYYTSEHYTAERFANSLGPGVTLDKANAILKAAAQKYWLNGLDVPASDPYFTQLTEFKNKIDGLRAIMQSDLKAEGLKDDDVSDPDSLFNAAAVHPRTLLENEQKVIDTMVRNGASRKDAQDAIRAIISGDLTVATNARQFMANHGVFKDPDLKDVFEGNFFTSLENLKDKVSSRLMHSKYLGEDGATIKRLLFQAKADGEFESEADFRNAVTQMKSWYDIVNGRYTPLDDYPTIKSGIAWGSTLTLLATLGKATFSSMVEVPMMLLGTPGNKIWDTLKAYGDNLVSEIKTDIQKGGSVAISNIGISYLGMLPHTKAEMAAKGLEAELEALRKRVPPASTKEIKALERKVELAVRKHMGHVLHERLGYADTGYNTQSKFEIEDSNLRKVMQVFASIIGLRAHTDAARMAILSMSSDVVSTKLTNLMNIDASKRYMAFNSGKGLTNAQAADLKELQSHGMDVLEVLHFLDTNAMNKSSNMIYQLGKVAKGDDTTPGDPQAQAILDNMYATISNLTDSKMVNPQAHNIPRFYHDARLRPITVMTRFVSTMHAVVLPRLYRDYIKDGNTGMRYQAFSVIAGTLVTAVVMNALKDLLGYGEDNPYLEGYRQNIQRTVYSSGLIGRLESPVDTVFPLYPDRKPDPLERPLKYAWDTTKDLSPVAAWAERPMRALFYAAEGDTPRAVHQGLRAAPLVGSFPVVSKEVSDLFKEN